MYRRAIISFAVVLVLLALPVILLIKSFQQMTELDQFVEQQHQSLHEWERLSTDIKSAEILTPAFEEFRDKRFSSEYRNDFESIPNDLLIMRTTVTDSLQLARLDSISDILDRHRQWLISGGDEQMTQQEEDRILDEIKLVHQMIDRGIERSNFLLKDKKATDVKTVVKTEIWIALMIVAGLAVFFISSMNLLSELRKRRRLIEELERKNRELSARNVEMEDFAYITSHHFQEPIRIISSFVQLIQRRYADKLDQPANEFFGYALVAAARMKSLMKDMLRYLNISWQPSKTEVDCNKVVKKALENHFRMHAEKDKAQITVNPLPHVQANELQLVILFTELLNNAVKFRGHKNPEIIISGEKVNHHFQFSVRDNGIGMDPSYNKKVFTIFQRLHNDDKYPGTGIGLSICKKIVEAHAGKIWYESREGEGTTMYFTLAED